jgi:ribosome-associated protein
LENTLQEITPIDVSYQPIELCKLLKIANMVGGGGEAKIVISEGYVYVNGEVEFQKRKKIYHQDIVEFNGEVIAVHCAAPVQDVNAKKAAKAEKLAQTIEKKQQSNQEKNKTKSKTKSKNKSKTNKSNKNQSLDASNNEVNESPVTSGKRKRISF